MVTLEPPSSLSVALCLANIAVDKLIKVSLKANVAEQLTTAMQQAQQVQSAKELAPH